MKTPRLAFHMALLLLLASARPCAAWVRIGNAPNNPDLPIPVSVQNYAVIDISGTNVSGDASHIALDDSNFAAFGAYSNFGAYEPNDSDQIKFAGYVDAIQHTGASNGTFNWSAETQYAPGSAVLWNYYEIKGNPWHGIMLPLHGSAVPGAIPAPGGLNETSNTSWGSALVHAGSNSIMGSPQIQDALQSAVGLLRKHQEWQTPDVKDVIQEVPVPDGVHLSSTAGQPGSK